MQKSNIKNKIFLRVGIMLAMFVAMLGTGLFATNFISNKIAFADNQNEQVEEYSVKTEILAATSFSGGDGSVGTPYLIESPEELALLANKTNSGAVDGNNKPYASAVYKLIANINLADKIWTPIGVSSTNSFKGTFNGNGYSITNLYTDYKLVTSGAYGLFGCVNGATIKNLQVINCNVIAGSSNAGGVVGYADGSTKIESCYVAQSTFDGTGKKGGILGYANTTAVNIVRCYTKVNILGSGTNGSIVGANAKISNCLAYSSIKLSGAGSTTEDSVRKNGSSFYSNNDTTTTDFENIKSSLQNNTIEFLADKTRKNNLVWYFTGNDVYLRGVGNVYVDSQAYIAKQDYTSALNTDGNSPYNKDINVSEKKGLVKNSTSITSYSSFYELGETINSAYITPSASTNVWVAYQIVDLNGGVIKNNELNVTQNSSSSKQLTENTIAGSNFSSSDRQGYFSIDACFDNIIYTYTIVSYDASPSGTLANNLKSYSINLNYTDYYYSQEKNIGLNTNTLVNKYSQRGVYNFTSKTDTTNFKYLKTTVLLRYEDKVNSITTLPTNGCPYLAEYTSNYFSSYSDITGTSYGSLVVDDSKSTIESSNTVELFFTNATKINFNQGNYPQSSVITFKSDYTYWIENSGNGGPTQNSDVYAINATSLTSAKNNSEIFYKYNSSYFPEFDKETLESIKYNLVGWSTSSNIVFTNVNNDGKYVAYDDTSKNYETFAYHSNSMLYRTDTSDNFYKSLKSFSSSWGENVQESNTNYKSINLFAAFEVENYNLQINIYNKDDEKISTTELENNDFELQISLDGGKTYSNYFDDDIISVFVGTEIIYKISYNSEVYNQEYYYRIYNTSDDIPPYSSQNVSTTTYNKTIYNDTTFDIKLIPQSKTFDISVVGANGQQIDSSILYNLKINFNSSSLGELNMPSLINSKYSYEIYYNDIITLQFDLSNIGGYNVSSVTVTEGGFSVYKNSNNYVTTEVKLNGSIRVEISRNQTKLKINDFEGYLKTQAGTYYGTNSLPNYIVTVIRYNGTTLTYTSATSNITIYTGDSVKITSNYSSDSAYYVSSVSTTGNILSNLNSSSITQGSSYGEKTTNSLEILQNVSELSITFGISIQEYTLNFDTTTGSNTNSNYWQFEYTITRLALNDGEESVIEGLPSNKTSGAVTLRHGDKIEVSVNVLNSDAVNFESFYYPAQEIRIGKENKVISYTDLVEGYKTIYANVILKSFIVYFNLSPVGDKLPDGSTLYNPAKWADGTTAQVKSETVHYAGNVTSLPIAIRNGYNFVGWSTQENSTEVNFNESTQITSPIMLYPVWEEVSFNISYNFNDAGVEGREWSGSQGVNSIKSGQIYTFPELVSDSHDFIGWTYTYGDLTITNQSGDQIIWDFASDMTFTANWKEKTFEVQVKIYSENLGNDRTSYSYNFISNGKTYESQDYGTFESITFGVDENGFPSELGNKPSALGYTFVGYSLTNPSNTGFSSGNISSAFPSIELSDDNTFVLNRVLTLYVIYKNHYTLEFYSNNNDFGKLKVQINNIDYEAGTIEATYGENITLIAEATAGYELANYTITPNINITNNQFTMPKADEELGIVKIVANFNAKTINITYDANGGEFSNGQTTINGTVTFNNTNYMYGGNSGMPIPTRDGYDFDGWVDAGGIKYSAEKIWDKSNDSTLFATWDVESYEIIFDINSNGIVNAGNLQQIEVIPNGSAQTEIREAIEGKLNTFIIKYGDKLIMPNIISDSHDLIGWYVGTNKDDVFAVDEEYLWKQTAGNTLTAVWEQKEFEVRVQIYSEILNQDRTTYSYNFLGYGNVYESQVYGSFTSLDFGVDSNGKPTLSINKPNSSGYSFVGYSLTIPTSDNISSTFPNIQLSDDNVYMADRVLTLYVIYKNHYTLTYVSNSVSYGELSVKVGEYVFRTGTLEVTYGETILLSAEQKDGYHLDSFISEPEISINELNEFLMPANDLKITANFKANEITIEYYSNYNSSDNSSDIKLYTGKVTYNDNNYTYGVSAISGMPTPTREGYNFDGWYDQKIGGKLYNTNVIWDKTENINSLYAHWNALSYQIEVNIYAEKADSDDRKDFLNNYELKNVAQVSLSDGEKIVYSEGYNLIANFDFDKTITLSGQANEGYEVQAVVHNSLEFTTPYEFVLGVNGASINVYYARKDYTLTLSKNTDDDNVIGLKSNEYTLNYGQTFELPTLSRTGYEFKDYSLDSSSSVGEYVSSFTQGTSSVTLYAIWELEKYDINISFEFENLSGVFEPSELYFGNFDINCNEINNTSLSYFNGKISYKSLVTISNVVLQSGFEINRVTYNGAELLENNGAYNFNVSLNGGKVVIYASRSEYTLTLDLNINDQTDVNIGDWQFVDDIATTKVLFEHEISLPNVSSVLTGYDFIGWGDENGDVIYEVSNLNFTQDDSAVTLYAIWDAKSYDITYDFNETDPCGDKLNVVNANWENEAGASKIKSGEEFTFRNLTSDSHNFLGWTITANGKTYTYKVGENEATIIWNYVGESIAFEAIWQTKSFKVDVEIWHANLSSTDRNSILYTKGLSLNSSYVNYGNLVQGILPSVYNKEGYSFVGYFDQNSNWADENQISISSPITSDITIYMLYKNFYKLNISSSNLDHGSLEAKINGVSIASGDNVSYGETVTLVPTPKILNGYTESGYEFNNYSITPYATITNHEFTMPKGDEISGVVEVVVTFKAKEITITYDANGGIFSNGQITATGTVTYQSTNYTFKEIPTWAGLVYTFIGWNTSSDGLGITYTNETPWAEPYKNSTLYAIWEPTPYEITIKVLAQSTENDNVYEPSSNAKFVVNYVDFESDIITSFTGEIPYLTKVDITNIVIDNGFTIHKVTYDGNELTKVDNAYYSFNVTNTGNEVVIYLNREVYEFVLNANTGDKLSNISGWNFVLTDGVYKAAESYKYGTNLVLPAPIREGYNFNGWNGYSGGSTFTVIADTELVADWAIKSFQITIEIQGLTNEEELAKVGFELYFNDELILEDNNKDTSFTTNSFYSYGTELKLKVVYGPYAISSITGIEGLQNVAEQTFKVEDSDNVITITFMPVTDFIINLNAPGATSWDDKGTETLSAWTFTDNNQVATRLLSTGEVIDLIVPIRTGYNFVGWATTANAVSPDYTEDTYQITDAAQNSFTLYAVWDAIPYEVTIYYKQEKADGSGEYELSGYAFKVTIDGIETDVSSDTLTGTYDFGTNLKITLNGLSIKDGFEFKDIIVKNLEDNSSYTVLNMPFEFEVPNYNSEITIRVERRLYNVNLNPNADGDEVLGLEEQFQAKYGLTVTLPIPTRAGYDFDGWTLEKTSSNYITEHTQGLEVVTYYAQWTKTEFKLDIKLYINNSLFTDNWEIIFNNTTYNQTTDGVFTFNILFNSYTTLNLQKNAYELNEVKLNETKLTFDDAEEQYNMNFYMPSQDSELCIYLINKEYKFVLSAYNYLDMNATVSFTDAEENGWTLDIEEPYKAYKNVLSYGTIDLIEPISYGYEFMGWSRESLGQGTTIEGNTYTQDSYENVVYYAVWERVSKPLNYQIRLENANDDDFTELVIDSTDFDKVFDELKISYTANDVEVSVNNGDNVEYKTIVQITFKIKSTYRALASDMLGVNDASLVILGENKYTYTFSMPAEETNIVINIRRQVYTLTFDDGLGDSFGNVSNIPKPIENVKFEQNVELPVDILRTGYTFDGWYTGLGGYGTYYDNLSNLYFQGASDEILYANWKINQSGVTIKKYLNGELTTLGGTFTVNGETLEPNASLTYFYEANFGRYISINVNVGIYELEKITVENPTLSETGTSVGFYLGEAPAVIEIYFIDKEYTLTLVADNYIDSQASVTFNTSTGWEVNDSRATLKIMSGKTVDLISPSSIGYEFLGWYSMPEGEGEKLYDINAEFTQNTSQNIVLYAHWELGEFVLTTKINTENILDNLFSENADGLKSLRIEKLENGSWIDVTSVTEFSYNSSLRYVVECKEGYNLKTNSFSGIEGSFNESTDNYIFEFKMAGNDVEIDINIYRNVYKLSFENSNSNVVLTSSMPESEDLKFGEEFTLPSGLSAIGYTFKEWNTSPNGDGTSYSAGVSFTQTSSNNVLYSIWDINKHDITIQISGAPIDEVGFTLTNENGEQLIISDGVNATFTYNNVGYNTQLILAIDSGIYNLGTVSGVVSEGEGNIKTFAMPDEDVIINIIFGEAPYQLTLNPNTTLITDYDVEWTESELSVWNKVENSNNITTTIYSNNTIALLPTPTIKGLKFTGWYTGLNGTGNKVEIYTQTSSQNVTLYANYVLDKANLNIYVKTEDAIEEIFQDSLEGINGDVRLEVYDLNSKTWIADSNYTYGSPIKVEYLKNVRIVFTINSGFELSENNVSSNIQGKLTNSGNTYYYTFIMTNEDSIIKIDILRSRFDLEFNKNTQDTVTNLPTSISLKMGGSYVIENFSNMTRKGYSFTGNWLLLDAEGNTVRTYKAGDTYTQSTTKNTILYAEWSLKTYTVKFDFDGGESNQNKINIGYDTQITMPDVNKDGFELIGWTISIEGQEETYVVITGDTLRSLESKYSIDLVGNEQTRTFVIKAVWNAGNNFVTVISQLDETKYEEKNLDIYLRPNDPLITFYVNGVISNAYEAPTGSTIQLQAEMPEGYQIKEWLIDGSAIINSLEENNIVEITNFTSNFKVTLIYEPIEISITLNQTENGLLTFAEDNSGVYDIIGNAAKTLSGVKINIKATAQAGYLFNEITADNLNVSISQIKNEDTADISVVGALKDTVLTATFVERPNLVMIDGENISTIKYQVSNSTTFDDKYNNYSDTTGITIKTGQYLKVIITTNQGYSVVSIYCTDANVQYPYVDEFTALIDGILNDTTIYVDTELNEYTLSTGIVNGENTGTIDIQTLPNASGKYSYGTEITMSANSALENGVEKYDFVGWYNDVNGQDLYSNENPLKFTIKDDTELYAKFQIKSFNVSYSVSSTCQDYGKITGSLNQTVTFGESAESVTAVAGVGYTFTRWVITKGENISYVNEETLLIDNVTTDVVCVAEFNKIDVTINLQVSIEGEIITDGIDKVAIQYLSGAEGDSISTAELLEMTLTGKSNTDIKIKAVAKTGYTFGDYQPYSITGNVEVLIEDNILTLRAKEAETNVIINFGKRENAINSSLTISGSVGGGLIRYQKDGIWQHTGATYEVVMKTETTLTYKVFVTPGYQIEEIFKETYVDGQVYYGNGYIMTITTATDYTGLDELYFTEAYDVTISGYKTDIEITIPIERLRTLVTFHNGNLQNSSETFTAEILYGTTEIVGATLDQLIPTSDTHSFVGWANSANAIIINSAGKLESNWLFVDETYDLYAQWQEKLIQINIEIKPENALQSQTNFYTTLFANSSAHGLKPEAFDVNGKTVYYTRPLSRLYLTLPVYKSGYIFEGFYLLNPESGEYEKITNESQNPTEDYATSTNCLLNLQGFNYYTYLDSSLDGSINIMLAFDVITTISAENYYGDNNRVSTIGGSVKFVSVNVGNELNLTTGAGETIKMLATPDTGYRFLYWQDETGLIVCNTEEFETTALESKQYKAVFVGNRIQFNSDYDNIEIQGGNLEVYNDAEYYHVGDIVRFKYNSYVVGYDHIGWEVIAEGEKIATLNGIYPSYTLSNNYNVIKINPTFTEGEIDVSVVMSGLADGNGTITFSSDMDVDYNKVGNTYNFTIPYETNIKFTIVPNIRYTFDSATVKYSNSNATTVNVLNNIFAISYDNYNNARKITININFKEIYWREYVLESKQIIDNGDGNYSVASGGDFIGNGSEDYPYELNSMLDVAKLAFIINYNIKQNDNQKEKYAKAVYELNQDINFADRYWTPIGTRTNPFKGTIYLRGERTNIFVNNEDELFPANTSFDTEAEYYSLYGKLFGFLDGANIIVEKPSLTVLWIVIGCIALIILIVILVIIISNERRKRITDERNKLVR